MAAKKRTNTVSTRKFLEELMGGPLTIGTSMLANGIFASEFYASRHSSRDLLQSQLRCGGPTRAHIIASHAPPATLLTSQERTPRGV